MNQNKKEEVFLIGYVGLGGTMEILEQNIHILKERFSSGYLRGIGAYRKELIESDTEYRQLALMVGPSGIFHPIHEGGILTALWEICDLKEERNKEKGLTGEKARVGLKAGFERMPIKQETVELCEYGKFHPYEMSDYGSALVVTGYGEEVKAMVELFGKRIEKIGELTGEKERVIYFGEEKRFLEKPRRRQYEKTNFKMY